MAKRTAWWAKGAATYERSRNRPSKLVLNRLGVKVSLCQCGCPRPGGRRADRGSDELYTLGQHDQRGRRQFKSSGRKFDAPSAREYDHDNVCRGQARLPIRPSAEGGSVFKQTKAFSGFSVNDLQKAKTFYGQTLGLEVSENGPFLDLHIAGGTRILITEAQPHLRPSPFSFGRQYRQGR
jgi:hypothetical protein